MAKSSCSRGTRLGESSGRRVAAEGGKEEARRAPREGSSEEGREVSNRDTKLNDRDAVSAATGDLSSFQRHFRKNSISLPLHRPLRPDRSKGVGGEEGGKNSKKQDRERERERYAG